MPRILHPSPEWHPGTATEEPQEQARPGSSPSQAWWPGGQPCSLEPEARRPGCPLSCHGVQTGHISNLAPVCSPVGATWPPWAPEPGGSLGGRTGPLASWPLAGGQRLPRLLVPLRRSTGRGRLDRPGVQRGTWGWAWAGGRVGRGLGAQREAGWVVELSRPTGQDSPWLA